MNNFSLILQVPINIVRFISNGWTDWDLHELPGNCYISLFYVSSTCHFHIGYSQVYDSCMILPLKFVSYLNTFLFNEEQQNGCLWFWNKQFSIIWEKEEIVPLCINFSIIWVKEVIMPLWVIKDYHIIILFVTAGGKALATFALYSKRTSLVTIEPLRFCIYL